VARNTEKKKHIKTIQKMLWERLREKGFSDVAQFSRSSGLGELMSYETVRRALLDADRPPSPMTVGVIMRHLSYSGSEIREMMQAMGDTFMYTMIPAGNEMREAWEEGLLNATRKLVGLNDRNIQNLRDFLEILSRLSPELDLSAELSMMIPPPRTRTIARPEIKPKRKYTRRIDIDPVEPNLLDTEGDNNVDSGLPIVAQTVAHPGDPES